MWNKEEVDSRGGGGRQHQQEPSDKNNKVEELHVSTQRVQNQDAPMLQESVKSEHEVTGHQFMHAGGGISPFNRNPVPYTGPGLSPGTTVEYDDPMFMEILEHGFGGKEEAFHYLAQQQQQQQQQPKYHQGVANGEALNELHLHHQQRFTHPGPPHQGQQAPVASTSSSSRYLHVQTGDASLGTDPEHIKRARIGTGRTSPVSSQQSLEHQQQQTYHAENRTSASSSNNNFGMMDNNGMKLPSPITSWGGHETPQAPFFSPIMGYFIPQPVPNQNDDQTNFDLSMTYQSRQVRVPNNAMQVRQPEQGQGANSIQPPAFIKLEATNNETVDEPDAQVQDQDEDEPYDSDNNDNDDDEDYYDEDDRVRSKKAAASKRRHGSIKRRTSSGASSSLQVKLERTDSSTSGGTTTGSVTRIRPGRTWTPEQDKLLVDLIKVHGAKQWSIIADMIPGKNGNQCCQRWRKALDPSIKRGRWSAAEDKELLAAVQEHGQNWKAVSASLNGRTGKQCRDRYIAKVDPSLKKGKWTKAEEIQAMQAYEKYGNKWSMIQKTMPDRSWYTIKWKIESMLKQGGGSKKNRTKGAQSSSSSSSR